MLFNVKPMKSAEPAVTIRNTIADFINAELQKRQMSNRALALGAGVSESVIRNLLQHGIDPNAKDPDPRTLRAVADYLQINPLILFRLAGYLPPAPNAHSPRAEFVAEVFDRLKSEKQDAVLGVIEALTENMPDKADIQAIRSDENKAFDGFDLFSERILAMAANQLIIETHALVAADLDKPEFIPSALVIFSNGLPWSRVPESTRQRVIGLAKAKLNLEYDATMVDPKWRK